ncbi:hypothetical protein [Mycolicibacterium baixiangningiae]|uniref:hypothetical protein n=1 Tax=Mycolicibacterium baixiangningiae TaxID=2761578 RepID=UPI0018D17D63|nr:hypothetical protein [Mycolicibacterium baixiangningiae]
MSAARFSSMRTDRAGSADLPAPHPVLCHRPKVPVAAVVVKDCEHLGLGQGAKSVGLYGDSVNE